MLRVDGGIPYDTLLELDDDALFAEWREFAAFCEDREAAMKARSAKAG